MHAGLHVQLLGPLQVTVGGREIGPGGALRRSLLALLALRAGDVVPVDALVDGLWGDDPPSTATGVLQTYVSTWRKAFEAAGLGPRIATVGAGYRLDLRDGESDLLDFVRLADDGRWAAEQGRAEDARRVMEQALALWHGRALADLTGRPFHASAVRPVEERRDLVVEDWAEVVLRTGTDDDLGSVATALQQLRAAQPWRERTTELLMWTLFRQARQRDALDLFEQTRRRLGDELGIDPGAALRTMHTRVLQQDPALLPAPAPRRVRVPPRLDSFVGREREVAEVHDLLERSRLVTLTGPGGSGKTRLGEEVAADVAADGVETVVVELAPVEDVGLVPSAISARLDLGAVESMEALAARLADRRLLLVMDNLEQLPDVGLQVTALLHGTAALRVLATSREPLRVAGEHVYPVDPLPVPAVGEEDAERLATIPSVALLLDRARSRGGAPPTDADGAALRDVVRALDGLPLALEIVAPWLGVLGSAGLLAELDHRLDLTTRAADAVERHRTLRAAIAWSHDRLSAPEQRLLRRMSVLRGSGDLDAVRAVGGDDLGAPVLDVLVDLTERNLVQRAEPVAGLARFRLLETVRQFAAERLVENDEREATELRAAEHYAAWAVELAAHGEGADAAPWLGRAAADADNLRAAMECFERIGLPEQLLQLVVDAEALWFELGYESEGERRLERALQEAPTTAPARALGLIHLSWAVGSHDTPRAEELADEAIRFADEAGDDSVLALAFIAKGDLTADTLVRQDVTERAVDLAERLRGRPVRRASAAPDAILTDAADILSALFMYRDVRQGIRWSQRSVEAAERTGDRRRVARQLALLSVFHLVGGDVATAGEVIGRARSLVTSSVNARHEDNVAGAHAMVLLWRGEHDAAEAANREVIRAAEAGGRLLHVVRFVSISLVDLLLDRGRLADADAVLTHAQQLVSDWDDLWHVTPLRARRARLLRMSGRPDEAVAMLEQTQKGIDPDELTFDHVVWLVEHALLADDPDEAHAFVARLEDLSQRTGVAIPPWERRLLAASDLIPASPG